MDRQVSQPILVPYLSWYQTPTCTYSTHMYIIFRISLILASHEWVNRYRVGHIDDSNLSTCPTWLLLIPSTHPSLAPFISLSLCFCTSDLFPLSTSGFFCIIFYASVFPQQCWSDPFLLCHFTFDTHLHSSSSLPLLTDFFCLPSPSPFIGKRIKFSTCSTFNCIEVGNRWLDKTWIQDMASCFFLWKQNKTKPYGVKLNQFKQIWDTFMQFLESNQAVMKNS